MPGLYLYAIADAPPSRPGRGIFGERLRTISAGGVHAIVGPASAPPRATIARLRAQDRVVRALATSGASVLPARFGVFCASRAELESALAARRAPFRRALRRVRGSVQMTVRLFPAGPARKAPRTSGAAYLRHLASVSRERARNADVRRLQRTVKALVRAERVEWQDGPALVASVYHLVPRTRQREYLAAVARLAASGVALRVSGPWLPFAFAEDAW